MTEKIEGFRFSAAIQRVGLNANRDIFSEKLIVRMDEQGGFLIPLSTRPHLEEATTRYRECPSKSRKWRARREKKYRRRYPDPISPTVLRAVDP